MKHLAIIKNWNRTTRHEKIDNALEALADSGKVQVEYLKGRPYPISLLLGEGNPMLTDEKEAWNQVRIEYQGERVLKILDSGSIYTGYLFDDYYSEDEKQQIEDTLAEVGFLTWQTFLSKSRWRRFFHFFGAAWGSFIIGYGCIHSDYIFSILGLTLTLLFLWSLKRK